MKSVVAYGGTSVFYQASQLQSGCNILVATPGRLLDFVEKGRVSLSNCKFLVLDEADRMLDMGFMPEIQKMVEDPSMPKKAPEGERQTLMFSATFPDEVQESAQEFLHDYLFVTIGLLGYLFVGRGFAHHQHPRRQASTREGLPTTSIH